MELATQLDDISDFAYFAPPLPEWPRVALAATSLNLGGDVTGPGSQLPELPQLPRAVTGPAAAWCSRDKHLTGCQVLDNGEKIADLTPRP